MHYLGQSLSLSFLSQSGAVRTMLGIILGEVLITDLPSPVPGQLRNSAQWPDFLMAMLAAVFPSDPQSLYLSPQ